MQRQLVQGPPSVPQQSYGAPPSRQYGPPPPSQNFRPSMAPSQNYGPPPLSGK